MRSQPLPGEASRQRAEERFKTPRQAEAEKTARLRALRLAREAADKDTADRDAAAAKALKSRAHRRVPGSEASSSSEPSKADAPPTPDWATIVRY
jgi:hypothetical protein